MNWPRRVVVGVGDTCAPQHIGVHGLSCEAAGTGGATALKAVPVQGGSPAEQSGTVTVPLNGVAGRYVVTGGLGSGWLMLDEIRVKDTSGNVVSTGRPYVLAPKPSVEPAARTPYGDDLYSLVDTSILPSFEPQFSQILTGITTNTGGFVQTTWNDARAVSHAAVWMTEANSAFGVTLPSKVTMQWRDRNRQWQPGVDVTPNPDCGPSPCARLALPACAQATGVRATFPVDGRDERWVMVSEINAVWPFGIRTDPAATPRC